MPGTALPPYLFTSSLLFSIPCFSPPPSVSFFLNPQFPSSRLRFVRLCILLYLFTLSKRFHYSLQAIHSIQPPSTPFHFTPLHSPPSTPLPSLPSLPSLIPLPTHLKPSPPNPSSPKPSVTRPSRPEMR